MNSKPVTIITSDLHVGGGAADPGDDFVDHNHQFSRLVREQGSTPEGRKGDIELIINGDLFEFVQVCPEAYDSRSTDYWCSQPESVRKVQVILDGHPDVFRALCEFQESGNRVTIFAGNHDVDLYWGDVQNAIRKVAGNVTFEANKTWYERYEGSLRISHGHILDPANRFHNWGNPTQLAEHSVPRLEMCPGTLFMVRFVNGLEGKYPFIDNVHPVTRLAPILRKEDRHGFAVAAWQLSRFALRHPTNTLGPTASPVGHSLRDKIASDNGFLVQITNLYRKVSDLDATPEQVRCALASEGRLSDFLTGVIAKIPPEQWLPIFDPAKPSTLSTGASGSTLSVVESGMTDAKEVCRGEARKMWNENAEVVVIGHTHLPDQLQENSRNYFNPGSWTRYLEANKEFSLTLEGLKDEKNFPYRLNYIRVEMTKKGGLRREMVCYEEQRQFG